MNGLEQRAEITNEVADVFRLAEKQYLAGPGAGIANDERKVFRAIINCRTSQLGGHVDTCNHCGEIRISYNSCRNRHCPKCQFLKKEKWLLDRQTDLLPISYFHVVFTIPSELNVMLHQNKRELYGRFFKSVAATLQKATARKYKGARFGFICILHSWGQNLSLHPHIHCIVTAGGLSLNSKTWLNTPGSFLLHVRVLSRLFRGVFLDSIRKAYRDDKLEFTGNLLRFQHDSDFREFIANLYKKEWVVYSKEPFENSTNLLKYLGRYTHRIAISNHRLLDVDDETVSFRYKDYRDENKRKVMRLKHEEFIRRFLLHVLPHGFVRIRHYGIFSNRTRKTNCKICRSLLNLAPETPKNQPPDWKEFLKEITGYDVDLCPVCKIGQLIMTSEFKSSRAPPALNPHSGTFVGGFIQAHLCNKAAIDN